MSSYRRERLSGWGVEIRRKPASEYNSDARSIGLDQSASQVARVTGPNCHDVEVVCKFHRFLLRTTSAVPIRVCPMFSVL